MWCLSDCSEASLFSDWPTFLKAPNLNTLIVKTPGVVVTAVTLGPPVRQMQMRQTPIQLVFSSFDSISFINGMQEYY